MKPPKKLILPKSERNVPQIKVNAVFEEDHLFSIIKEVV